MRGRIGLDGLAGLVPTYPEQGGTRADPMPAGYAVLQRRVELGRGRAQFERAGSAVMAWQVQQRAGLRITPSSPTATAGTDVLLGIGVGPLRLIAPCRVIYEVDEPGARGFAYGTLPGHPECGEESFVVHLDDDGRVSFAIRAFSRPATLLARLGGPVTTIAQRLITRRYLAALRVSSGP